MRVRRLQDGDYSSELFQGVSWANDTFLILVGQFKFNLIQNSTRERKDTRFSHQRNLFTLHKNVIFRQQEGGYLGQLPHRRAVSIRDDGAKLVQCVVQVVHSPALSRVNIQPHALPLTSRL